MRLDVSSNKFSIGLALFALISAGAASAQSLTGVNARLDHTLDSKSAAVGQVVTAKLDDSVKSDNGVNLPRGTELIGKIAEAKSSQNGGPATLSIVFTTAKLKNGKEVPLKVTVLAAASQSSEDGVGIGPAPATVSGKTQIEQSPGAISHVALVSAVSNNDSGTFSRNDGNFRLDAGTSLQVGVAPAGAASGTNAAE